MRKPRSRMLPRAGQQVLIFGSLLGRRRRDRCRRLFDQRSDGSRPRHVKGMAPFGLDHGGASSPLIQTLTATRVVLNIQQG
jgi:hypothetical protein